MLGAVRGADERLIARYDCSEVPHALRSSLDLEPGQPDPPGSMWIGDLVEARFEIIRPIGSGGMGSVFLAADRVEGRPVAVKVLDLSSDGAVERFRREARVLSELSHPGIVRYIAHGETAERQPFLAMELLEGEDLAARLARGAISVQDGVALVRRAAEALAFAHSRGIVHRDVKPSNLFLVGGDAEQVKMLDFGIARTSLQTQGLTQTGAMLGTVGYMAPEQAAGSRDVDARADVFALGCVLFECLTGRATFAGEHAVAILAKVLTEEAPHVTEFCPDVGAALDALVARMLAKQPADRPADATAFLRELDALGQGRRSSQAPASSARLHRLGHAEQRVVAVILGELAGGGTALPTATPEQLAAETETARATASRYGADVHVLPGGAMVFVVSGKGAANDLAVRAVSLALAVARVFPSLHLVVATGRAQTTGRLPVGDAIDRAAAILRAPSAPPDGPLLDDVTAALVGARCVVREERGFCILVREARDIELPRLLLGKPTPTIGREKELGLLDATLAECIEDSVARMVLVTAAPGTGKSRLGGEFVSRTRRGDRARVLVARGEATGGGLLRDLASCAAGLRDGDGLRARQEVWFQYVHALMQGPEGERVGDLVGEAIGVPSPGRPTAELLAARNDPRIMASRVRDAIPAWLAAECARGPLVLLLEDLHWADAGSVSYIEEALSRLSDRPLLVIALTRPEGRETFPKLWERSDAQEIKLGGLTRRSAERLVHLALEEGTDSALIARIVEHAGGNAFYLEELIRAAAEGRDDLPESVTAMATFRLDRLEPDARRVLRAASIFGERFPTSGVVELLGGDPAVPTLLRSLASHEVIDRIAEGRFAGEDEYAFRHALLRDAAYGMLTGADRLGGHAMAGEWLAGREEAEPLTIAEHFEKAELREKAAKWWASEAALAVGGRRGKVPLNELVAKALACGASGRDRAICLALSAYLATARADVATAIENGREAMSLLPATTREWFFGAGAVAAAGHIASRPELAREVFNVVSSLDPIPAPTGPMGWALMCGVQSAVMHDEPDLAVRFVALMRDATHHARLGDGGVDPIFLGHEAVARCYVEMHARDSVAAGLQAVEGAPEQFGRVFDIGSRFHAHIFRAAASFEAGDLESALSTFERGARFYDKPGNGLIGTMALAYWAWALAAQGRGGADDVVGPALTSASPANRALARVVLAQLHLSRHDADGASEVLVPLTMDTESTPPFFRRTTLALQARVALLRGAAENAALLATRAAMGLESSCATPYFRSLVLLTHAECLYATGRREEAAVAIRAATDRLLRNGAEFEGEANKQRYLMSLPHNRRTIELASAWLGD